jgi:histidinol-phosphate aminotransferase
VAYSRRDFFRLGAGGAAATLVVARGHEALGPLWSPQVSAASAIQLDSNENPNGPGARALDAIRNAFGVANRYPYGEADALTAAIAKLHGIRSASVILGCGSAEVLRMTMQAFTTSTRPLVTAVPTFETPAEYAATFGVPVIACRVDGNLKLDLAAMERQSAGAGVVYLCNPNNPTGTILPPPAIASFVNRLLTSSPKTVVLIDEAYHEYVEDPSHRSAIALTANAKNVIVSRTFSKLYGMAGLRCGYGVAHPDTIAQLSRFKLETSVNQLAIAGALAAVMDQDQVGVQRTLNRDAKQFTRSLFEELGFRASPSEANFLFVDLRRDATFFRDGCRRQGVHVGRAFPPLGTYARISIGTMDEMRRAGDTFRRVLRAS